MKHNIIRNSLSKTIPLKIISCILGYCFWYALSENQYVRKTVSSPICFYNLSPEKNITSLPETVTVNFEGKRKDFRYHNFSDINCYIDGETLNIGTNYITLTPQSFFLPDTISITHQSPSPFVIKIHSAL